MAETCSCCKGPAVDGAHTPEMCIQALQSTIMWYQAAFNGFLKSLSRLAQTMADPERFHDMIREMEKATLEREEPT